MVLVKRKCPTCKGTGRVDTVNEYKLSTGIHKCIVCNGTGRIWDVAKKAKKRNKNNNGDD